MHENQATETAYPAGPLHVNQAGVQKHFRQFAFLNLQYIIFDLYLFCIAFLHLHFLIFLCIFDFLFLAFSFCSCFLFAFFRPIFFACDLRVLHPLLYTCPVSSHFEFSCCATRTNREVHSETLLHQAKQSW